MTDYEIRQKIERLKLSDAPLEIKDAAIREWEAKLSTNSSKIVAQQQLMDSMPDYSDIGD